MNCKPFTLVVVFTLLELIYQLLAQVFNPLFKGLFGILGGIIGLLVEVGFAVGNVELSCLRHPLGIPHGKQYRYKEF